jgi:hypothetical protein
MDCIHDWLIVGLNSHYQTDVVYIDFSKAFDSIVHTKLLFKLRLYGVDGPLLKWIEIFLSNVCNVLSSITAFHLFVMLSVAFPRVQCWAQYSFSFM